MAAVLEESESLPLGEVLKVMQERIVTTTSYFGVLTQKNPLDFWVYQEMINELRPTVLVEIGNKFGGSALAFAHLFDIIGEGRIIAVDIDQSQIHPTARAHPRIAFLEGDATELAATVKGMIGPEDNVLVIEDSSHTYENTISVLENYASLVKSGGYFIVEDSNCHHGLDVGPNPGPYEAIERFLETNHDFESDRSRESFLITWNPKGFLRRK
jgi:cephalosporin hydroxylase